MIRDTFEVLLLFKANIARSNAQPGLYLISFIPPLFSFLLSLISSFLLNCPFNSQPISLYLPFILLSFLPSLCMSS